MRLWSIHPKYLDSRGLVAVWREGLLAKKVLEGNTKGYRNHSQLVRFEKNPLAINSLLYEIYKEAKARDYEFDVTKIKKYKVRMPVTKGQIEYEFRHLLKKLKTRDPEKYVKIKNIKDIKVNEIFYVIPGKAEEWERV